MEEVEPSAKKARNGGGSDDSRLTNHKQQDKYPM
jgi:hypothetical protein